MWKTWEESLNLRAHCQLALCSCLRTQRRAGLGRLAAISMYNWAGVPGRGHVGFPVGRHFPNKIGLCFFFSFWNRPKWLCAHHKPSSSSFWLKGVESWLGMGCWQAGLGSPQCLPVASNEGVSSEEGIRKYKCLPVGNIYIPSNVPTTCIPCVP